MIKDFLKIKTKQNHHQQKLPSIPTILAWNYVIAFQYMCGKKVSIYFQISIVFVLKARAPAWQKCKYATRKSSHWTNSKNLIQNIFKRQLVLLLKTQKSRLSKIHLKMFGPLSIVLPEDRGQRKSFGLFLKKKVQVRNAGDICVKIRFVQ